MIKTQGYAAKDASSRLEPFSFDREEPAADEVQIEVLYCGICHSDIHQARNEWGNSVYPCVPGHEVVGRVTRVGGRVSRHAVGDLVGVGCMVDSCRHCAPCRLGEQNYCEGPNSWLATYNGPMVPKAKALGGRNLYGRDNTFGGYSDSLVVKEDFVLKVPASLKPEVAAPILCAGVTTWSPLRHWDVQPGQHVGVIGFGGLGDMAVKLARALGARVTVFTRTEDKLKDAQRLGAQGVLESDEAALAKLERSFDFMLSTIPEKHDLNPFIPLLKRDGTLVVVGALEPMAAVNHQDVAFHRRSVAGSLIGSIEETQEVLDFCAEHDIGPDVQLVRIQDVNEAFDSVERGEARFRYVIDMASLKGEASAAAGG